MSATVKGEIEQYRFPVFRVFGLIVVLIVVIWIFLSTFVIVPAGHRGVVLELGAVSDVVLGEGFHVITPFIQNIHLMEVRTQKYEVEATAATKDLLDVTTRVAVNYHLSETAVNKIYQTIGPDFENRIIAPAEQETVKAITARFNAEELITQRATVKHEIEETLRERLQARDIIVETISLTDFQFPQKFNQAIIDKQTAIQLKLKAENDLERIKVEADQQIAKARGEAESIKIINEELQRSPQYLQFLAVQKWDGVLPIATGSGAVPFINIPTYTSQ